MARFDRFTKALALGSYREAFMSVITSDAKSCFDYTCFHNSCPSRCLCNKGYCQPTG